MYFNLNTFAGFRQRVPALRKRTLAELLGGRQDVAIELGQIEIPPQDIPDLGVNWLKAAISAPRIAAGFLSHSPRRAPRFMDRVKRDTEALWRAPWRSLPDRELVGRINFIIDNAVEHDGFLFLGVGLIHTMSLFNLCRRWFGETGDATASRLLAGLGSLENAEAGLALWRLALLVHEHPDLERAVFGDKPFAALREELSGSRAGRDLLARWDSFLWRHGHHTRGEVELFNARWSEEPEYVRELLISCVRAIGASDPLERADRLARERQVLATQSRARLRNPIKRLCFDYVLKQAQRGAPIRENLKSELVRRVALVRLMLLELGERLARRGVLGDPQEIFFLRLEELEPVLGEETAFDVGAVTATRRREYDQNLALTPPAVIVGRFDPRRHVPEPVDESATVLKGVAVSPGVAEGPARVLLRAGREQVEAGEILVAPFTDPGWTPYFLNAAGIVMDLGGLLSHGSIVAREYGIPCVVNVGAATKIVRTGQTIRVDADRGEVTILR